MNPCLRCRNLQAVVSDHSDRRWHPVDTQAAPEAPVLGRVLSWKRLWGRRECLTNRKPTSDDGSVAFRSVAPRLFSLCHCFSQPRSKQHGDHGVAVSHGRAPAVVLAVGIVTGSLFWAILAATGIPTLLSAYAGALVALKIAGGLFCCTWPTGPHGRLWPRQGRKPSPVPRFRGLVTPPSIAEGSCCI